MSATTSRTEKISAQSARTAGLCRRPGRRDDRLRPDRAVAEGSDHHRHPDQYAQEMLRRAVRQARGNHRSFQGRGASAAHHPQDRCRPSAAGSTSPRRRSTPACPTARASTSRSGRLPVDGPLVSIRKFSKRPFSMDRLIELGALRPPMAEVLQAAVHGRISLIVSGGTGSGKTTLLNALSSHIPAR